jgi:LuxR family maltose regulon positive regulatory protein
MHALAREALRQRFQGLPATEQAELHARAAAWLAANGLIEAAASHMLQSGQQQQAYDLAERSLYEALVQRGRHGTVLEWVSRLPAEELDRRPRLLLAAARHPCAARRGRRATLRMRTDSRQRGGVRRRPGPLCATAPALGR